jgi:hypothetical protein
VRRCDHEALYSNGKPLVVEAKVVTGPNEDFGFEDDWLSDGKFELRICRHCRCVYARQIPIHTVFSDEITP